MIRGVALLTFCLANQGCLSMLETTVTRVEWLRCCKLCDRPKDLDLVNKVPFADSIECVCKNGQSVIVPNPQF